MEPQGRWRRESVVLGKRLGPGAVAVAGYDGPGRVGREERYRSPRVRRAAGLPAFQYLRQGMEGLADRRGGRAIGDGGIGWRFACSSGQKRLANGGGSSGGEDLVCRERYESQLSFVRSLSL